MQQGPAHDHRSHNALHQVAPPPDQPRGWVRMAVMDGKTMGHRVSVQFTAFTRRIRLLPDLCHEAMSWRSGELP